MKNQRITANLVVAQLLFLEAEDPDKDIHLYVGPWLYYSRYGNMIQCYIKPLSMYRIAASMEFPAQWRAKGKRFAVPNAEVMIHQPLGGARGQATDIQIHAEHILKIKRKMNQMLSENTGQPLEKIERDVERDYFMSAQEAKEYGLIDEVISSRK